MYLTALGISFKQSYMGFSLCSAGLLILQLWMLDILRCMAANVSGMGSSLKQSVDVPLQKKNCAIFDLGYERSGAFLTFWVSLTVYVLCSLEASAVNLSDFDTMADNAPVVPLSPSCKSKGNERSNTISAVKTKRDQSSFNWGFLSRSLSNLPFNIPNQRQPMRWLVAGNLHPTHRGNFIWWESQTFCTKDIILSSQRRAANKFHKLRDGKGTKCSGVGYTQNIATMLHLRSILQKL